LNFWLRRYAVVEQVAPGADPTTECAVAAAKVSTFTSFSSVLSPVFISSSYGYSPVLPICLLTVYIPVRISLLLCILCLIHHRPGVTLSPDLTFT
jgi:hypothetical protein